MSRDSGPTPAEDLLYAEAAEGLAKRLEKAEDHVAVLSALRWGMTRLDATYAATPAPIRMRAACQAGCDFCCRVPLGVQAHEVFLAAEYIRSKFTPEQIGGVIERTRIHRERVGQAGAAGYFSLMQACALLQDGKCTIYEARPEICRSHHSSDAQACEEYLTDQGVDLERVYIHPLRRRMFAVMLGIDEGFAEFKFDGRAYDFGSALHEAMTDELCAVRWAQKQAAFPDFCLEPGD